MRNVEFFIFVPHMRKMTLPMLVNFLNPKIQPNLNLDRIKP